MTLAQIGAVLEARVLWGKGHLKMDIKTACACDLMSDVLALSGPGALLLTGLVNPQVVRTAEMAELAAICFVRGKEPERETLSLAADRGIPLLRTRLSMFESCGILHARGISCGCKAPVSRAGQVGTGSGPLADGGGRQ